MLKKTGGVLALVGMCVLSVLLSNCGSSSSRPTGLLYVISQAENNVSSFSIDLNNGGLSLINSNATTCTTLTQTPPVSCGLAVNMLLDPTKATAFVLNQGLSPATSSVTVAPTIYGYTVNSDGSLSAPSTSATLPLGDSSLATTESADGTLLFVIDQGSSLNPTDCPNTSNTYGPDCPSILVFTATPGSTTLTQAFVQPLSVMPTALSVLTFTPPNTSATQTLLFMTSNVDLTSTHNDNELSVYSVDPSSGKLTPSLGSPYTTLPNPLSVLAVNTNVSPATTGGVYVYVGAQGSVSGSISAFLVCTVVGSQGSGANCTQANDQLIPIGTPSAAGKNPAAMLVDPTNNFLYVASSGSNQIFAFEIATVAGTLTPLSPASEPSQGASPAALVMHPSSNTSNEFLYVSNNGSNNIGGFSVGVTSGSLSTSPTTTLFTPGLPSGMAAK